MVDHQSPELCQLLTKQCFRKSPSNCWTRWTPYDGTRFARWSSGWVSRTQTQWSEIGTPRWPPWPEWPGQRQGRSTMDNWASPWRRLNVGNWKTRAKHREKKTSVHLCSTITKRMETGNNSRSAKCAKAVQKQHFPHSYVSRGLGVSKIEPTYEPIFVQLSSLEAFTRLFLPAFHHPSCCMPWRVIKAYNKIPTMIHNIKLMFILKSIKRYDTICTYIACIHIIIMQTLQYILHVLASPRAQWAPMVTWHLIDSCIYEASTHQNWMYQMAYVKCKIYKIIQNLQSHSSKPPTVKTW